MDNGYWVKFKVSRTEPNVHIPHGIRYSLTLHDKNNKRVVGYDNAHGIKTKRKRFSGTRTVWDHKHSNKQVGPYEFEDALSLMEDFWKDVNMQILK